jgi:hypothetical protein
MRAASPSSVAYDDEATAVSGLRIDLVPGWGDGRQSAEEVARLSVRLVLQSAQEAEVTESLDRERDSRGGRASAGHRNG